jgi:signal transduction histidine kinase
VTLDRQREGARLLVIDDGPGVYGPDVDGDVRKLFERFTRAERSRTTTGHGLGLALVAAIAVAHRGNARITPPPGFGVAIELAA